MTKSKIEWADHRRGDSRIKTKEGYILIYCPGHPHAKSSGHVYEHRYLMERQLGRYLESNEPVHHRNKIRSDNEPENLELISPEAHGRKHASEQSEAQRQRFIEGSRRAAKARAHKRELIFCACGCSTTLINRDRKGRLRKFVQGHNQTGNRWNWYDKN